MEIERRHMPSLGCRPGKRKNAGRLEVVDYGGRTKLKIASRLLCGTSSSIGFNVRSRGTQSEELVSHGQRVGDEEAIANNGRADYRNPVASAEMRRRLQRVRRIEG
jgi:hypothetical protein